MPAADERIYTNAVKRDNRSWAWVTYVFFLNFSFYKMVGLSVAELK